MQINANEVRRLVSRALNQAPEDRESFLIQSTLGDDALLQAARRALQSTDLTTGFLETGQALNMPSELLSSGDIVGAWRVQGTLGMGGMGEVYEVSRADGHFEKSAALKLISSATETIWNRFTRERQILADLENANIARLLDGGVTQDGRPFLVMELIDGVSTAEGALLKASQKQRIQHFVTLCRAVEYAHQRLIVHGDIKPANIMISASGELKLLDFGVASLMREDHDADKAPMTLAYAAPEQIAGEPSSVQSDIYSLGLTLAEWLTDTLPTSAQFEDNCRSLPADLRAIIDKATSASPEDRYESASQLRGDLTNYLTNKPVSAREQTAFYTFGLFARRNPATVMLSAGLMASLVLGLAAVSIFALQLQKSVEREAIARLEAENRAALSTEAKNLLINITADAISQQEGAGSNDILNALNEMRNEAISALKETPSSARMTLYTLSGIHDGRADLAAVLDTLAPFYENEDSDDYVSAQALITYGLYAMDSDLYDRSRPAFERAIAIIDNQPHPEMFAYDRLEAEAYISMISPDPEDKLAIVERLGRMAESLKDGDTIAQNSAVNMFDLAAYLSILGGDMEGSIPYSEKALELNRQIEGPKILDDGDIAFALVGAYSNLDMIDEALALNKELIAEAEDLYGPSVALANRLLMQGMLHARQERPLEAKQNFEKAYPLFVTYDRSPSELGFSTLTNIAREDVRLAGESADLSRFDELEAEYGQYFEVHPRFGYMLHKRRAESLEILGRNPEAISEYEIAIEYAERGNREDYVLSTQAALDALRLAVSQP